MKYRCNCGNFEVNWDADFSNLIARKCGCDYCRSCSPEYMSDPNTKLSFIVKDKSLHNIVQHGFNIAKFHECVNCGLILVTTKVDDGTYGVVNVANLGIEGYKLDSGFNDFSGESSELRLARRKKYWCKVVD